MPLSLTRTAAFPLIKDSVAELSARAKLDLEQVARVTSGFHGLGKLGGERSGTAWVPAIPCALFALYGLRFRLIRVYVSYSFKQFS
jgi:hypothetical protein